MDIYFVRHGQTDGNIANRHQHPDIELNEVGKVQAVKVASVFKKIKPTYLITSTNVRALETAKVIGLETNLIPETYPYFEELHRPTWLIGKRYYEWSCLKYMWGWFFEVNAVSMHDGETYQNFCQRLGKVREHLSQLPPNSRIVIVSHSVFINFFLEHMNNPNKMGITRALIRFAKILLLRNTAIIHVKFADHKWIVVGKS